MASRAEYQGCSQTKAAAGSHQYIPPPVRGACQLTWVRPLHHAVTRADIASRRRDVWQTHLSCFNLGQKRRHLDRQLSHKPAP